MEEPEFAQPDFGLGFWNKCYKILFSITYCGTK